MIRQRFLCSARELTHVTFSKFQYPHEDLNIVKPSEALSNGLLPSTKLAQASLSQQIVSSKLPVSTVGAFSRVATPPLRPHHPLRARDHSPLGTGSHPADLPHRPQVMTRYRGGARRQARVAMSRDGLK